MELSEIIKIISEQGMGVVAVGFLLFLVWRLVKFGMTRLVSVIDKVIENMNRLADKMQKHEEETERRSRYIRDEHKEMITALGRINGYKKD